MYFKDGSIVRVCKDGDDLDIIFFRNRENKF